MHSEQSPEACASRYKASESGGSSLSKSAGSKEVHPGSGSAAEPTPFTSQSSPATKTVQGDFDAENTDTKQKSLVRACGVQKKWGKELHGLDFDSQVAHIRKILHDVSMRGQMSMEQAKRIRGRCELAQELEVLQRSEVMDILAHQTTCKRLLKYIKRLPTTYNTKSGEPPHEAELIKNSVEPKRPRTGDWLEAMQHLLRQ
ncbi:hypothetical protein BJY52DRAFT_1231210 [Lactarius psammicola]|nr:hypothetical protein BJY52DRAFT_1231210 [Lactarius psammicola]